MEKYQSYLRKLVNNILSTKHYGNQKTFAWTYGKRSP